ncbi:MAG: hypothetical protein ABF651_13435 [Sporolactobacillus sp.]
MTDFIFVILGVGLMILEEYVLANTRFFWLGGILPLAMTAIVLVIIVKDISIFQISDYILAASSLLLPYVLWGNGHDRYKKYLQKEIEKMKAQDHQ